MQYFPPTYLQEEANCSVHKTRLPQNVKVTCLYTCSTLYQICRVPVCFQMIVNQNKNSWQQGDSSKRMPADTSVFNSNVSWTAECSRIPPTMFQWGNSCFICRYPHTVSQGGNAYRQRSWLQNYFLLQLGLHLWEGRKRGRAPSSSSWHTIIINFKKKFNSVVFSI